MFFLEDARGQGVRVVGIQHRHRGLHDDRAVVEFRRHEVHRAAVNLDAGLERAPVRMQAGERRQQRRMDVDQAVAVTATAVAVTDLVHIM